MRKLLLLAFSLVIISSLAVYINRYAFSQSKYSFPPNTVTNVILVPADVELDAEYPRLVSEAVKKIQARFSELLDGQTFQINQENGDPVIIKSSKPLEYFCNPSCDTYRMSDELRDIGFPVFQNQTVLNVFGAGLHNLNALGFGDWDRNTDSGMTWMGEVILGGLKGNTSQYAELLCQTTYGSSCTGEIAMRTIAHELGHAFGLLMASRWANAHPCSVSKPDECRPDLDKKFYPNADEWNYSLMGYGSGGRPLKTVGLNDSCVNPEKTLLKHHPFFGGEGYKGLKFDGCLKTASEDIKITSIETVGEAFDGDSITINTDGLLPEDQDLKVFFPQDEAAFRIERINVNKIKAVIPAHAISGDILLQVTRNGKQIRSIPHPFKIYSLAPRIERVEPSSVKPGDIVTLYGSLFVYKKEGFDSKPSIVIYQPFGFIEPIEYDEKHLKFKIPDNISLGQHDIQVSLDFYYNNENIRNFVGNRAYLEVVGTPEIEVHIEADQTMIVGEPASITVQVSQKNSTPESAEVWVRIYGEEEGCKGDKRVGDFCRIGSARFTPGTPGQVQKFTAVFTPLQERPYGLFVNAYGSNNLKCSGDPNRPLGWVDCGERSRIYPKASQKETATGTPMPKTPPITKKPEIRALYYLENKLEKEINLSPHICRTNEAGCSGLITNGIIINLKIPPGSTQAREYIIADIFGGPIRSDRQYTLGCWADELDKDGNYSKVVGKCPDKPARAGDKLEFAFQATNEGLIPVSLKPGVPVSREPTCSLTASKTFIMGGELIKWEIKNDPPGATAYWRGSNNNISIIPVDVQEYSNATYWSKEYKYLVPGIYRRYVGIQDEFGKTVCTTESIYINVAREEERVFIPVFGGRAPPSPISSVIPDLQTGREKNIPKEDTKTIVGILVNGQWFGFEGNPVSIKLPDVVAKGATHSIPITVNYSDNESFSRNIVFRYKLAGTQETREEALPGEECNPQRFSCFVMAERSDNNPELLFCRNLDETTNNRYEWVTQKFTTDICQGKEGITTTCGDGQGQEVKYWCTGETWVDEARWAAIQKQKEEERQRQVQETQTSAIQTTTPQGIASELSCSLWASSEKIKEGENITWVVQSNLKGISAEWRGTDNGKEINPVPVSDFTNTNYWSQTYPYKEAVRYTRYATLKIDDGKECTTNTVDVAVEKRELAEVITNPVQNITGGLKTISRIVLTVPPYGQQRVINQGEPIRFSLPDTGGVPQTIQLPITIIYSDGTTTVKTISFSHKGNTCALSNGKCANSNGQTQDGYQCSTYRSDLTGCSIEKDNVYPYCYTGCSQTSAPGATTPIPTQFPTPAPTPEPIAIPTPSPFPEPTLTPQVSGCPGQCATSVGDTASGQRCTDWLQVYDDACPVGIYDYCFTNCR